METAPVAVAPVDHHPPVLKGRVVNREASL